MWQYNNISLIHHGVKGMKWGVRRKQDELDRLAGRAYKIETLENGDKNWHLAYNKAVNEANEKLIPKLNKKYEGVNFNDPKNAAIEAKYDKEGNTEFNKLYAKHFVDTFGERPISSL